MSKYTPSPEAVEAACKTYMELLEGPSFPDDWSQTTANVIRATMSAALTAAAPFIRAEAQKELRPFILSVKAIIEATSAYLPPDGISKDELICRVFEATENAVIVAALAAIDALEKQP